MDRIKVKLAFAQPEAREIRIKLILAGGHSAVIALPPEHALLNELLAAVAAPPEGGEAVPKVFQIPVEGGRASLLFASHRLVAVVTDPAVLVRPEPEDVAMPASASAAAAQGGPAALPDASPSATRTVRHAVAQIDEFLTPHELDSLRETVFAAQAQFQPSWTQDDHPDYRKSMVLNAPEAVVQLIVGKVRAAMPKVMAELGLPPFPVGHIECQVTASLDGSYFRVHTDSGNSGIDATRQLTYVYYFNREPRAFSGGLLRVYDDELRQGKLARTDSFRAFEPRGNSILFFHSAVMHEVTPVSVPSRDFRDSRFTVNGWIHRV